MLLWIYAAMTNKPKSFTTVVVGTGTHHMVLRKWFQSEVSAAMGICPNRTVVL